MSWFSKKTVVVPVDFSDDSFEAVELVLSLLDDPSRLHVVHVLQDVAAGQPGMLFSVLEEAERRDQARKALVERFSDSKYSGVAIHVSFGDPGQVVAEFATQIEAELIVLPSHGRSGVKRLLIGSVAERITRLAHCPVLILRR